MIFEPHDSIRRDEGVSEFIDITRANHLHEMISMYDVINRIKKI